ncbi:glycosyltransferase family 2 protein [Desulfosediminicola ganghwensis]|uniref:glycosyltransferase family 2 protein n=1 Tax=Desulfosediminicola ganghwensis TaxID=2569540 RepID=UPI0010AD5B77|nr:glycosyltransferase family 2 protein [Desulfosediminicola ganghwensis]
MAGDEPTSSRGVVDPMNLSIIIPVCNGEKYLRSLFESLASQTLQAEEILVVDSSSTDGSVAICNDFGVDLTIIAREDFDHGGTRTMMAQKARGELLLFMTQDAIPKDDKAVENLVAPFADQEQLAMTYGRQLPRQDASFAAAHLRHFNYLDQSMVRRYQDRKTAGLGTIFTSNSFAAFRASALAEIGYFKDSLIFGEDTFAAGRLLQKGYIAQYVSEAVVYHSHNYKISQEFKRYFDIGVLHTVEASLFKDFGRAERKGGAYFKSGFAEIMQRRRFGLIADFSVRTAMKYLGYKAGKNFEKLPAAVVPELSLHKSWWSKQRQA